MGKEASALDADIEKKLKEVIIIRGKECWEEAIRVKELEATLKSIKDECDEWQQITL